MEVSGGSIHDLCDDLLSEILVRLDAVSVLRCRAVCKRWRRIATGCSFLTAHAGRRPREMIVITEYGFARSAIPTTDDGHRYLFDPHPPAADGTRFELCASLDGLLVLEQRQSHPCNARDRVSVTYIICNPATRQWTNLPSLRPDAAVTARSSYFDAVFCGFYFHASSGEYRVLFLCVIHPVGEKYSCWYFCVVSAGGALPRRLARGTLVHKPEVYELPLSYHGALHWLSPWLLLDRSGCAITAFDTISETFRLVPGPPELEWMAVESTVVVMDLLQLDGELSIATMQNYVTLDIWTLQDYEALENHRWTRRHRVNLQRPPWLRRPPLEILPFKVLSVGGSAILIGFPRGAGGWLYCLRENGVHREIDCRGTLTFREFSESLVPHAFFDLPRCPEIVPLNLSSMLFSEMTGSN